ncbi:MAG: decarboxylating NADP(+)-dependent phosphogluconate dehydrogenase, partial [Candidatus Accumulibacter sp.]|nr:decarboxylating NADP(+)-dependent phosphogluconate dehydrogenase [Accumulibacter sp.]
MEPRADIALIGLAVMGQNLILNMNDHGFTVVAYNRSTDKVDQFLGSEAKGTRVLGAHSIVEMVAQLKRPRRVMMLVKAGRPVDEFIDQLIPHLEAGDIIIDGGNSLFEDTNRRQKYVEGKGLLYIGTGVSGGEEGARHGPSIMPGGSPAAWPFVKDIFQAISAKVEGNVPCCEWVGEMGAGHYVKMVHNGIEYGDMQLICEAYNIMKTGLGMSAGEMHEVFKEWNAGELDSYLIEITRDILAKNDDDGQPLVDKILDTAGQKGTGKWTVINSQDLGIPITLMAEAVYSRCVSALKNERLQASARLAGPDPALAGISADAAKKRAFVADIRSALYASKIVSYAQGYMLMRAAAGEYGWNLNYGGIALMWRGGCIIRSRFLGKIKAAFDQNPALSNLLLDDYFRGEIGKA